MCVKKEVGLPSYVVLRHNSGALCVSIRDMTRDEVVSGLLALADFFSKPGDLMYEAEAINAKGDRLVIHPGNA